MVVEIRREGQTIRVRRFGTGRQNDWHDVPPGGRDEQLTRLSHEELSRLGDGVWELPVPDRRAS